MQAPRLRIPPIARMHSLRKLLQRKVLFVPTSIGFASRPSPFSPRTVGNLSFLRRLNSSCWSAVNHADRCSDEVAGGSMETGDPGEAHKVLTFYDPLEGKLVTRVAEEDGGLYEAEESTNTERTMDKIPVSRDRGMEADTGKGDSKKVFSSSVSQSSWASASKRKSGKTKVSWVCENCGTTPGQWWGTCPSCQAMNTIRQFTESESRRSTRFEVSEPATRSWLPLGLGEAVPQSLVAVNKGMNQLEWRIPLPGHFGMEVARVLGGGLVPGSLVLVGGDPGVGKSTLLLQIAASLAEGFDSKCPARVIYVSGEESIDQIGNRAARMRISAPELYLYSSTDIEDIMEKIRALSPRALIVDSVQTVYLRGVAGTAGNIMQVKECTSTLLRFAKQTNIPVLLGERYSSCRLLRSVKNRFGSTDELGVFEMSETGLQAVLNPSDLFLSENHSGSEVLAGRAVAVIVDGSRTFLIEIQALCVSVSIFAMQVNGVPKSRADMICAVLMKQAGLKLQDTSIFLNVVSGFKLTETAGDLAVAVAICSSLLEVPVPNDVAFIGEIGLGGELRTVARMDKRVSAVAQLGYKKCVIPKSAEKLLAARGLDITLVACRNVREVINNVFRGDEGC